MGWGVPQVMHKRVKSIKRRKCCDCGRLFKVVSGRGLCAGCGAARASKAISEMVYKKGEKYEKWKNNLKRVLE